MKVHYRIICNLGKKRFQLSELTVSFYLTLVRSYMHEHAETYTRICVCLSASK